MKRILFVEDDPLVARIYSHKLAEVFEVAVAEDGVAAMKRLVEFKPDLVVLDLLMPRLSGVDVLKFMRERPDTRSIRVVVLSNAFLSELGKGVAALGVDEMLAKAATTPPLLIDTINRVLDRPASESPRGPAKAGPESPAVTPPPPPAPEAATLDETFQYSQGTESAAAFRRRMRKDFFQQIPAISKSTQQAVQEYLDAVEPETRWFRLEALSRKIRFVNHMTGMAGCYRISQLANALEALLYELQEKPGFVNESLRHTIDSTVRLMIDWLAVADQPDEQCLSPTTVLVVDDDAVSNRALLFALSRANLSAKSVTDPFKALQELRENSFDAVLLDINLPGMSGFSLCEQMRALPLHKTTPVIFITRYAEFESRARSMLHTNDDFISKPILPIELTVKVTAHVLRRRLASQTASG